jgi:putative solute:sodium symporter small subunit
MMDSTTAANAPAAAPGSGGHSDQARRLYWRKNLRLTAALAALWFFVTFVLVYFARHMSFKVFGWPFSFWVAGQGALVVYCLIIWCYAWRMNRLDDELVGAGQQD